MRTPKISPFVPFIAGALLIRIPRWEIYVFIRCMWWSSSTLVSPSSGFDIELGRYKVSDHISSLTTNIYSSRDSICVSLICSTPSSAPPVWYLQPSLRHPTSGVKHVVHLQRHAIVVWSARVSYLLVIQYCCFLLISLGRIPQAMYPCTASQWLLQHSLHSRPLLSSTFLKSARYIYFT